MSDSILTTTKKLLGVGENDNSFDIDIIMHINMAFATLNQLGAGPIAGANITGASETWASIFGADPRLANIRSYVYLKTRMMFDPPSSGFLTTAIEKMILELEWRINVQAETPGVTA